MNMPNVKVNDVDGSADHAGREMLRQVVLKRMNERLVDKEALEMLVEMSGGVLRTLIELTRDAAIEAMTTFGERRLSSRAVGRAVSNIRNDYRRMLTPAHLQELQRVHTTKQMSNTPVFQELLHNASLLEYRNEENWCDVHPIVLKLLETEDVSV